MLVLLGSQSQCCLILGQGQKGLRDTALRYEHYGISGHFKVVLRKKKKSVVILRTGESRSTLAFLKTETCNAWVYISE